MSLSALLELRAKDGESISKQRGRTSLEEIQNARLQVKSSASKRLKADFVIAFSCLLVWFFILFGLGTSKSIFTFSSCSIFDSSVCLYSSLINSIRLFTVGRGMSWPTNVSRSWTNCGGLRQCSSKALLTWDVQRFWMSAMMGRKSERQKAQCVAGSQMLP